MKKINLDNWGRRPQFELYRNLDFPYFSLTANVNVAALRSAAQTVDASFTISLVYLISKTANQVPAFRTRIRGTEVVQHSVVHPSITVLAEDDQLGFCTIQFSPKFSTFKSEAASQMEQARNSPSLVDPPGADDMLFMSAIPWIAFTSVFHPVPLKPPDSIPRIAWGKTVESAQGILMPLSVQCHHAVMDGVHVGRFVNQLQTYLAAAAVELSD